VDIRLIAFCSARCVGAVVDFIVIISVNLNCMDVVLVVSSYVEDGRIVAIFCQLNSSCDFKLIDYSQEMDRDGR
jgi:hypothetical protein